MEVAERRLPWRFAGWVLILCGSLQAGGSHAGSNRISGFNVSQPAAGVYLHSGRQLALDVPGHDDIANIGFVIGEKCVAVIDTGGSVTTGRALRAAVASATTLPICYVVNTHVHVDHILGNDAFVDGRASFVGSAALPAAVARSTDFFLEEYGKDLDAPPSARQVIAPDRLVDGELTLDLGGRQLLLHAWPTAHSDCDLSIFDQQSGTLWAGDLLFRERLPAVDGSVKGWLAVIDRLSNLQVKLVVPGHGSISRDLKSSLAAERRYLQALVDGVRRELAQAKPVDDAIANVAINEKSHWLLWEDTHPRNVLRAYQELEWE